MSERKALGTLADVLGPQLNLQEHAAPPPPALKSNKKANGGTRKVKETDKSPSPCQEGGTTMDQAQMEAIKNAVVEELKKSNGQPAPTDPSAILGQLFGMMNGQQPTDVMEYMKQRESMIKKLTELRDQAGVIQKTFGARYAKAYVAKELGVEVPSQVSFGEAFEESAGRSAGYITPVAVTAGVTALVLWAFGVI